jgi:hypothetical protein
MSPCRKRSNTCGKRSRAIPTPVGDRQLRHFADRLQSNTGQAGSIEVVYRDARPAEVEGPFLAEERNLLNLLAELLGMYFERGSDRLVDSEERDSTSSIRRALSSLIAELTRTPHLCERPPCRSYHPAGCGIQLRVRTSLTVNVMRMRSQRIPAPATTCVR